MPLASISGEQAFANLRADRASLWPDGRRDRIRLHGVAEVACRPSFSLLKGEAIFTVGSCFARNIERRLGELGFDVAALKFSLPAEERASDTENDFLNKYPPISILNEVRWALDPQYSFPEQGYLQVRKDLWHDPHAAANLRPAPLDRVEERRAMVSELYAQIPACRVIVMTLGLIEAWFDKSAGVYLNGAPPISVMQAQHDRFRLDVLTPDEVLATLREIHGLLERFGHPEFRILLTVSPVPMKNTFTGQDAIAANTYSKSALRAAAEMFVRTHPRVDYFPSYEVVTHTVRSSAFIQDNRHVTPQVVNTIVDRVVAAYCPEANPEEVWDRVGPRKSPTEIHTAIKVGDFERAARLYGDLERGDRYLRAGYDEAGFRYDYGRVLLRVGRMAEAQVQLSRVVEIDPKHAHGQYQLARALARLQRPLEAVERFRRAAELSPGTLDMRLSHANQLAELGLFDAAKAEVREALKAHPEDERALALLESVRLKAERDAEAKAQAAVNASAAS
jgi:tetratricopeptide (TPR) repeat protein